jgi:hypothetical protein
MNKASSQGDFLPSTVLVQNKINETNCNMEIFKNNQSDSFLLEVNGYSVSGKFNY